MGIILKLAVPFLWFTFMAFWLWSAMDQKSAKVAEPFPIRFLRHWLPLLVAVFLVAAPGDWFGHGWLREKLLPHRVPVYATGDLVMLCGLMLAIWARQILGRNWSSNVQIKQGHELIVTGPYQYIRHPIYTALILMFLGNAIVIGDVRGFVAVAIIWVSFFFKYRREEQFMLQEFGDQYRRYQARTGALLPRPGGR